MEIKIGDRTVCVELISKEDNRVKITIDDVLFDLNIVTTENGVFSILHNGRSYNAELIRAENGRNYTVNTDFTSFPVEIMDAQSKYRKNRKKDSSDDEQDCILSHIPGKVVKVLVSEEEAVTAGQSLIIVEAMKMQNEYKAPRDCIIREIHVTENETVNGGKVLISFK